ncbi:MAG: ATP-binding protein [Betaproteobacteria bacterium]|jgi:hypothetical protein
MGDSEDAAFGGKGPAAGVPHPGLAWRDLGLVVLVTLVFFLAASLLEVSEMVGRWVKPFESYQLDELPAAAVVLVAGLAWSSWRRSRQLSTEMGLRLQAQARLDAQRQLLEVLFKENLSANLIADADGFIVLANPELARLFGFASPVEAVGRRLADFYQEPEHWDEQLRELRRAGRVDLTDLRLRRADGDAAAVIARITVRESGAGAEEIHAFFADVTALERTRSELAGALQENRRLAQRGIEMLEQERRHIARELHDEMGQWLNALKIDAVSLRDRTDLPEDARSTGRSIVELTDHVYAVARSLLKELRPVALDELGLATALQHCVDQWRRRHPNLRCDFRAEGLPESLGEAANIALYRLVQEGLTNVTKHSGARSVRIEVQQDLAAGEVCAAVSDDGIGMDPATPRTGLGLAGLRERVEMLGGRFRVDSAPGGGTRVHAAVPLVVAGAGA